MTQHIGIVACSAEGAALCYRTICAEGAALLGPHAHPEVSMHSHSLADYIARLDAGDLQGVAELMLASAHKLAAIDRIIMEELVPGVLRAESVAHFQQVFAQMKDAGCSAVILGCTEIPLLMNDANSPLPTLDSTRLLARAALRRATQ